MLDMTEIDAKLVKLQELTDKLDTVAFEVLRQKTSRALSGLLTYSVNPVVIISPLCRILDINNLAKKKFGYPENDHLIKFNISKLLPGYNDDDHSVGILSADGITSAHDILQVQFVRIPLVFEAEWIKCLIFV